jgi:glycosyltransferase involved in cell wall biosynthesis
MLRISVIIPTYNRANYLPKALDSISQQSWRPDEIIVVDDGSSDGTAELLRQSGSQVRYFYQDNKGVAAARNLGLAAAQGEVIAWLDADDLWEPDYLKTLVSLLEADPHVDGAYAGFTHIDSAGNQLTTPPFKSVPPGDLYQALIDSDFIITSAFVARKRCFERVGYFDEHFRICEDYDLFLRLAKVCTLIGVPQTLMKLRVHENNVTRDTQAFCRFRLALTTKHFGSSEAGEPQDWPEDKRRAFAHAFLACAVRYFQDQVPEEGWRYVKTAVLVWPKLLSGLDFFFELAFAGQSRAYRGRVDLVDIQGNGAELLRQLERLFTDTSPGVRLFRRTAYGNAYLTLGILSDQAGDWVTARRYLMRAVTTNLRFLASYTVMRRLLKLWAGRRLVKFLRDRS